MSSSHRMVQPEGLPPGRGYTHAVVSGVGRTVWVSGEIGTDTDGRIVAGGWTDQFDRALANVVTALRAAGAEPDHVVSMQILTTDVGAYREAAPDLAPVWRRHMGRYYPAMAVVGVTELVEPAARVEITATAVIPTE